MVLKFLGLGKKSEYFLEAEPQPSNGSEPAAKAEPTQSKPAPEPKSAPKAEAKAEAKTEAKAEAKTEAKVDSTDSAPAKVAAVAAEATATATKATEALAAKVTQATKSAKSPKSKKAAKSAAATEKVAPPIARVETPPKPVMTTFATDHLLPLSTPRRRPGPSLDMFKDMARQVNNRR